jgi:sulfur-oxidizing protein SoxY
MLDCDWSSDVCSSDLVFSFDFKGRPPGPFRVTGVDNNGNRIDGQIV